MNGTYNGPDSLKVGRPRHLLTDDDEARGVGEGTA
jgi:hypothetical protein